MNRQLLIVCVVVFGVGIGLVFGVGSPFEDSDVSGSALLEAPTVTDEPLPPNEPMTEPVTVAFVADTAASEESREVLRLIDDEDADVLVHGGDYISELETEPDTWEAILNEELGPEFPVIAVIGNHDIYAWGGFSEHYQDRVSRVDGLNCTGDYGLQSTCTYKGVTVVQSADEICSIPSGDDEEYPAACGNYASYEPAQYVSEQLRRTNSTWRICAWHMPSSDYQIGEKSGVPTNVYDSCREGGGDFITTGHNHAYARTHPMANFTENTTAAESPPYTVGNGRTIALVTGSGGQSFYEPTDRVNAEQWAATHTSGDPGAFFCTLRPDGTGSCYFKTTGGDVIDGPFDVRTENATNQSTVRLTAGD